MLLRPRLRSSSRPSHREGSRPPPLEVPRRRGWRSESSPAWGVLTYQPARGEGSRTRTMEIGYNIRPGFGEDRSTIGDMGGGKRFSWCVAAIPFVQACSFYPRSCLHVACGEHDQAPRLRRCVFRKHGIITPPSWASGGLGTQPLIPGGNAFQATFIFKRSLRATWMQAVSANSNPRLGVSGLRRVLGNEGFRMTTLSEVSPAVTFFGIL